MASCCGRVAQAGMHANQPMCLPACLQGAVTTNFIAQHEAELLAAEPARYHICCCHQRCMAPGVPQSLLLPPDCHHRFNMVPLSLSMGVGEAAAGDLMGDWI